MVLLHGAIVFTGSMPIAFELGGVLKGG